MNRVKEMNDKSDNLVINLTCESGPNIGKYMIVNDIWVVIDNHWHDLHKDQGTDYLDSECFRATEQEIKKSCASTTTTKRRVMKDDHRSSSSTVNPNRAMRNNKKMIMSKEELNKCETYFIFIFDAGTKGGCQIRCRCNNKGDF